MSENTIKEDKGYLKISRPAAWSIWLLASLFYFYQFFIQVTPSLLKEELATSFNLQSAEGLGYISSLFVFVYGLMQVPAGLLIDRYGPRKLLSIAVFTCAFGSYMFGVATHLWEIKLARIIMGLGASFAVVGTLTVSSMWFPTKRFALLTGLMVTIGMSGAAASFDQLPAFLAKFEWREIFKEVSIFGLVLGLLILFFMKERPLAKKIKSADAKEAGIIEGVKFILFHKQIWLVSIYASLMFLPTLSFGELWSVPFLMQGHGLDKDTAGKITKFIFIGWAFGAPLYGYISDRLRLRNFPMYFANIATIIVLMIVLYSSPSIITMKVLWFLIGFFSSGFIIAFAVVRESSPAIVTATAVGFINILNTLGGAVLQPVIGKILDANWGGTMLNDEKVFSLLEYQNALIILPFFLIVSLIAIFFVKETHGKQIAK